MDKLPLFEFVADVIDVFVVFDFDLLIPSQVVREPNQHLFGRER